MIIVKLQGGLGNQMFQYAAARSLTKKEETVYLDHEFFKYGNSTETFTARAYELDVFKNIRAKRASGVTIHLFKRNSVLYKLLRLGKTFKVVRQTNNEYVSLEQFKPYKRLYLDGYFQGEKNFAHIKKQLIHEFEFPELDAANASIKKQIERIPNSVCIHIRRTDYLNPFFAAIHPLLPLKYYYNALNALQDKNSTLSLVVFSDDTAWAKQNFSWTGTAINYIDSNTGKNSWKDMALMAACKHHIIANSSFSWWGAWLSKSEGEVFAPCKWFNPGKAQYNIQDIIPQRWNIVQYE